MRRFGATRFWRILFSQQYPFDILQPSDRPDDGVTIDIRRRHSLGRLSSGRNIRAARNKFGADCRCLTRFANFQDESHGSAGKL